jgi:tRNA(Ile)-lysidine synthase
MLRGEESLQDESYVKELCDMLRIPLKVCRIDVASLAVKMGMSVEEAGREARYNEFKAYAEEIGEQKIAVAHNRNDQAETVLMHIIRGSGLAGLVGMEHIRGNIIRPLLDVDRSEIEQYCSRHELHPRTDSSNLKCDYARNKVRLNILPLIDSSFGSDITGSLCRLSALALRDSGYIEECAAKAFEDCLLSNESKDGVVLDAGKLGALHPALAGRVIRRALSRIKGNLKEIESLHIDTVTELAVNGRTGAVLQLPGNIRVSLSYNKIRFYMEDTANKIISESFCRLLAVPGCTTFRSSEAITAEIAEKVENIDKYGKIGYNFLVQFFDYDLLKKGIYVRSRAEGDIFTPRGSKGTKKLKKYFIDCKIPREIRQEIPLVAIDNEIIWIVGYKTSDKFKVTENTKRVLILKYYKEEKI